MVSIKIIPAITDLHDAAFLGNLEDVKSFASFSIPVMTAQNGFYQDHPFVIGVLTSTAGELIKLSYDTACVCYDLMIGGEAPMVEDDL